MVYLVMDFMAAMVVQQDLVEQVVEEAAKRGMVLDEGHFVEVAESKKAAKKEKAEKVTTEKVTTEKVKGKGRPKKAE